MQGGYQQNYFNQINIDLPEYDSVAKTLTHKESEFPLIINRNTNQRFMSFKNTANIIDLVVEPRDKSLKSSEKQNVIQKQKEYIKDRIKIYIYPMSEDSIYVGIKLYNIDQVIRFCGKPIIHDFKSYEQIKDDQIQINDIKWVTEIGFKLTFTPYNYQEQYKNLKNECLFSLTLECSEAISNITILVIRLADDKQVFIL
ncbi:hypothetical protein ABPG74_001516 [Tetrahymena malaccensis]